MHKCSQSPGRLIVINEKHYKILSDILLNIKIYQVESDMVRQKEKFGVVLLAKHQFVILTKMVPVWKVGYFITKAPDEIGRR